MFSPRLSQHLLMLALPVLATPVMALEEMGDAAMSEVTGTGIAIVLNDVRITATPTSFLEFTGSDVTTTDFKRADVRWYGISITGTDVSAGSTWSGFCSSGILDMGCPQGGYISQFAPHDNPLLLRVFDHTGVDYQGVVDQSRTVLELQFPTDHEPYRFAFWGELNVDAGAGGKLQVQNIWNNVDQGGSALQFFQHSGTADPTLGLRYANYFEADIRMSLNQSLFSPDSLGMVPEFEDTEGLYVDDYRVYFPLGQLHYQSLIADGIDTSSGNFVLEVTRLPNLANAYNHHYGRTISDDPTGGYDRTESVRNALGSYHETHGYLRMGDWVGTQDYTFYSVETYNPRGSFGEPTAGACMDDRTSCAKNTKYAQVDGMFFSSYAGGSYTNYLVGQHYTTQPSGSGSTAPTTTGSMSTNNLGDSQFAGIMLHHLKITTLGTQ